MSDDEYDYFSSCPGCGKIGFTVEVWIGDVQMMNCGSDSEKCRVEEYRPRKVER